jgi:hypothetical protein
LTARINQGGRGTGKVGYGIEKVLFLVDQNGTTSMTAVPMALVPRCVSLQETP